MRAPLVAISVRVKPSKNMIALSSHCWVSQGLDPTYAFAEPGGRVECFTRPNNARLKRSLRRNPDRLGELHRDGSLFRHLRVEVLRRHGHRLHAELGELLLHARIVQDLRDFLVDLADEV